ncbi:MFS transporter, partial [Candidatus Kuenenbacteria bacterium]|nr:MFS transporter [Candidatus Kuenenbacteria bacterium]
MEKVQEKKQPFLKTVKSFSSTFWAAIVNEIYERGAWYGLFSLIALYLTGPTEEGALGLTHAEKGTILAVVPFFVYLVPLLSGTIGDKIGYKKVLLASFAVLATGYFSLSFATGYASFFGLFLLVALGAGMFKPMITGTVARVTRGDKNKASVGFAIFYMVVNLGGFFGPI